MAAPRKHAHFPPRNYSELIVGGLPKAPWQGSHQSRLLSGKWKQQPRASLSKDKDTKVPAVASALCLLSPVVLTPAGRQGGQPQGTEAAVRGCGPPARGHTAQGLESDPTPGPCTGPPPNSGTVVRCQARTGGRRGQRVRRIKRLSTSKLCRNKKCMPCAKTRGWEA